MRNFKQLLGCFFVVFSLQFVSAQKNLKETTPSSNKNSETVIFSEENKTLTLNASQVLSNQTIQWQESLNNHDWKDISGGNVSDYEVTLINLPKYYRAIIKESGCDTFFSSDVVSVFKPEPTNKLLWSKASTWGAEGKPAKGSRVVIPADKHIYLDEDTPVLDELVILGKLEFERKDVSLTARNILVNGGELAIGSERKPFANKAIITLNDRNTGHNLMGMMGTRGIVVVRGGKLELHGKSPEVAWTKINEHIEDGGKKVVLAKQADWKSGDEIVLGPTDFYEAARGKSITQRIKIEAIKEKDITLTKAVEAFHWGKLQYATTNGMSLVEENIVPTPTGDFLYGIKPNNPKILDERAPIGNLTRNIVIQSPDDLTWKEKGFGVHIMIMPTSTAHLNGVEIKRGGQQGKIRRYPFHWHMLSYRGSDNLGDATGQYIKNSTINQSKNRGIVVHGTNGTLVKNNIVYDVRGHAIFTEDAGERRTVFDHNLVLKVRNPAEQFALKKHELSKSRRGSSGFWISNPDNTTVNNHVGDSEGTGYWLAFPSKLFGESAQALYEDGKVMDPRRMPFRIFENNTAHSCQKDALHNDHPEIDEKGNTGRSNYKNYISDATGRNSSKDKNTWKRFTIKRFSGWKSNATVWERATYVNALETIGADNQGTFFAGSGTRGLIIGGLLVGRSLNYAKNESPINNKHVSNAFASYHHTFDVQANIAINFQPTLNKASGVFGVTDYYLRAVEKGHWLSKGNILIKSHPGVRLTASEANGVSQVSPTKPHFNLSGAIWDAQGQWGPKNNYLVPNEPFYTYNSTITSIAPNIEISGGVSVEGPFYGADDFRIRAKNGVVGFEPNKKQGRTTMVFTRYDDDLNEVDSFTLYFNDSDLLQNMKDFASKKGGIYEANFPLLNEIYDFNFLATNFLTEEDEVVIAFEFSGDKNATVRGYDRGFTLEKDLDPFEFVAKNNFEEVKNSPTAAYWQDKTNEKVWIKIKGGFVNRPLDIHGDWEPNIYQQFIIRIWER